MGVKQLKVDVNELTIGMFVSGLDRPWTQTPFPLQGFYIRGLDEIQQLKSHCSHVYIDVVKGCPPVATKLRSISSSDNPGYATRNAMPGNAMSGNAKSANANVQVAPLKIKRDAYTEKVPLKKEVQKARVLHQNVFQAIGQVVSQLEISTTIPMRETKRAASEMVDSVVRNPDAFSWLTRVREKDEYTYSHSVRSAVWAILFGRHMGLSKKDLDTLAIGVLLKDVGKVKLDQSLLTKAELSEEEALEYEGFVEKGVEILRQSGETDARVIKVVKTHCERLNGSGFPLHLKGDKIPLLGKVAGIVTFYDEITNPRGEHFPLAPSKAVASLYERRNVEFQEELVVEFIRAIGLYPTGTLVELNTGEVGVVVEQNFERRLKPKVMLVLDACKQLLSNPVLVDLAEDDQRKQALLDSGKKRPDEVQKLEIIQDMEPGSFDIDIGQIRDDYLFKLPKKGWLSFLSRS